ncbi:MAG TPA: ABC transporter permease [Candidatus Acidoferrales bacterium]
MANIPFSRCVETILADARYGIRGLLRQPGFALTALLAIALGVGSAVAVFSVVDRALFRPLPYPAGDRMVTVGYLAPIEQREFLLGSDYVIWRDQQTPFASMTSFDASGVTDCDLTAERPARLGCTYVESNFLPTFGVQPLLGRNISREEDQPNGPEAAMISYALWKSKFGSDPNVIGRTISLDKQLTTIVGVLRPDFELPTLAPVDVLLPQQLNLAAQRRPNTGAVLRVYARLKPGVSAAQATAALEPLFEDSLRFVPPQFRNDVKLSVRSVRDLQTHDVRLAFWILLGAVGALLLLPSANVANLLLARATVRRREFAIRAALGASRGRLVRQTLTESLLLGVAGGTFGVALAAWLLRIFIAIAPQGIPRLSESGLNLRVLMFAFAASMISALLFGLAPALRSPSGETLTGGHSVDARSGLLRQSLAAAQIAVSLVLLTAASLLLQSFRNVEAVPLGMQSENVLTASMSLGEANYPQREQRQAFFEELEARLSAMPGAEAFAMSDEIPPSGRMHAKPYNALEVSGQPRQSDEAGGMVGWRIVTPGYFSALRIPIVRGRGFNETDRSPNTSLIVLSQTLAQRLFDALGARIRLEPNGPWYTVIGVAGNVKNAGVLAQDDPEYYVVRKHDIGAAASGNQSPEFDRRASVIIRSSLATATIADWIREQVSALDPTLPIEIETMNARVGKLAARPRFNASVLTIFAVIGVLLAAIGLYGVVSFLVAQRTQEIGIRMALGATPRDITRLVLARASRWTAAGILLGLIGSLAAGRVMAAALYQVSGGDARTLAESMTILAAIALFAAWIPSRRAARIDPVEALRRE